MAKITYSKLNLKAVKPEIKPVQLTEEISAEIIQYLPQNDKAEFLSFVMSNAIDDVIGCFSPLRLDTYFNLALAKWYAGITFTDKQMEDPGKLYDTLEVSGILQTIVNNIPHDEYGFISDLTDKTAMDIARYNNSAAGIIGMMSNNAGSLDEQIADIMSRVQNKEGLEELAAIKDIMGN